MKFEITETEVDGEPGSFTRIPLSPEVRCNCIPQLRRLDAIEPESGKPDDRITLTNGGEVVLDARLLLSPFDHAVYHGDGLLACARVEGEPSSDAIVADEREHLVDVV